MSAVPAIGPVGPGLAAIRIQAQYQAAVLKKQVDLTEDLGQLAVQLIQAAVVATPATGQTLDVVV